MPAPARDIQAALEFIEKEKAGFIPPFCTGRELAELLAERHRLHDDIGEFQLAGYSVVAMPRNGERRP